MNSKQDIIHEATSFIKECYKELNKKEQQIEKRLEEIEKDIKNKGHYIHTKEELAYGAKMAWRNNNRCIGRLFWDTLHVIDKREAAEVADIKEALFEHIEYATNGGKIKPTITIFHQSTEQTNIRILNHQLIRYAGYETKNGIIGDPDSLNFTKYCQELGWRGQGTYFDVLPLVVQINEDKPQWFPIPEELILEVSIRHPEISGFQDLKLKWYAVPIISNMRLEIGGIQYTAAPFNGWYMGTEIGARNFADDNRYNMLPKIASMLELNQHKNASLWKDKALVELNIAVLHSFQEDGVAIVDHHTAAQQFKIFEQKEENKGRDITGNWAWLIPPMSPAATHIFHKRYNNETKSPNFFNQKPRY
ncbi:nitric oxide synthase oxygenase [Niallia sp. NCCP-28]|uniref:nitric oxide synthase oxygenase n=1 Tax=Niallia sp. NCCP-28 TaxID=2934712 RepID=UPI0020888D2D|nr:nitric oxide synthase oxygenase [Niallia sp. NCCP-28]GKU83259.1 nitric oxide synthase oxygenase [Niallia sp. NCCP-28]